MVLVVVILFLFFSILLYIIIIIILNDIIDSFNVSSGIPDTNMPNYAGASF